MARFEIFTLFYISTYKKKKTFEKLLNQFSLKSFSSFSLVVKRFIHESLLYLPV